MSVIDVLRAIPDQDAFALGESIKAATQLLMNAKRRKAAADAAVANAETEQTAAAQALTGAEEAMEALRQEIAGILTPAQ